MKSFERPFDPAIIEGQPHSPPAPPAEALDISIRHPLGHSIPGHRDVRQRITEEHESMELSNELLKDIHRSALGADTTGAGKFRSTPSYFPEFDGDGNWVLSNLTIPSKDVPVYLDSLHERFRSFIDSGAVHPILPIAAYAFDILRIHPFTDGNGRLIRLSLLLLLHKSGYHIGRYISIGGIINMRRLAYHKAIFESRTDWISARHDLRPWCAFVVETIRDAYREFSDRTVSLEETARRLVAVSEMIANMPHRFSMDELTARVPEVPDTLTRTMLDRMLRQGKLRATLNETAVEWWKVDPASSNPET